MEVKESYAKFNYLLRPAKQVERKVFLEAFHRMAEVGFPISEYGYLGLGSVYFADFVLFYKYLLIEKMICAELADIEDRMQFNMPYPFITLVMGPVTDAIPRVDSNEPWIAWLDYDQPLNDEMLGDIRSLVRRLHPGSILLVTVDAEPRIPDGIDYDKMTFRERRALAASKLQERLGKYREIPIEAASIDKASLPRVFAEVMGNVVRDSALRRDGIVAQQLFNFKYADGAQMLTVGWLVGEPSHIQKLDQSGFLDRPFINTDTEPRRIDVPPMPIREKLLLDQTEDLPFAVADGVVENFTENRRHYPIYFETIT